MLRKTFDPLEAYIFQSGNAYINDGDLFEKGHNAFREGQLPAAILYLEGAVQKDSEHFEASFTQGWS